ncbi:MAG TPA: ThiF family adenylyltransferase, partial [Roseococcus sp.]|nr:ThiF family adenylyltransferase [Roseococcus sp.]
NLQRQVAHATSRLSARKVDSAAAALADLNPEVKLDLHPRRLDAAAARELIPCYDVICDGTDNFPTRVLLGDACHLLRRPLVSAAVLRFEGQLSVFRSHEGPPHPCHRCLHPEMPPEGLVPSCSEAGVLGATVGVMGTLQATEVLKLILGLDGSAVGGLDGSAVGGIGTGMSGRLLLWDALDMRFRDVRLKRDPACALCGPDAAIRTIGEAPALACAAP